MAPANEHGHGLVWAVAHQRCPECGHGIVYRHRMEMNQLCPACGVRFEREPGYFSGAIFIGLLVSFPITFVGLFLIVLLFPDIPLPLACILSIVVICSILPLVLRLSRIVWMLVGRDFAPGRKPSPPQEPPELFQPPPPLSPVDSELVTEHDSQVVTTL